MGNEKLTTIQVDIETRKKLKELSAAYERTAAGQLRWMVNQDYEKLQQARKMVAEMLPKLKVRKAKAKKALGEMGISV